MIGPEERTSWLKVHAKIIALCLCILATGILFWCLRPQSESDSSSNKVAQRTLVTSLATAVRKTNDQEIINITSQLINGAKKGDYKVDDATLANYRLERATSYMNIKQYSKVASDTEAAVKLSSATQPAAYAFEFEARYRQGERQSLIPLLNKLIETEKSSSNPLKGSEIAQYQQDITDIQHNTELSF